MKVRGKVLFNHFNIEHDMEEVKLAWWQLTAGKTTLPLYSNFTDEIVGLVLVEGCTITDDGVLVEAAICCGEMPRGLGAECNVFSQKLLPDGKMLVQKMLILKISTVDKPFKGSECEKVD